MILQAIHAHAERISLGKKKAVPVAKKVTKPTTRPTTRKTSTTVKPVTKKQKEEEVAIHESVLGSDLIASSNENQTVSAMSSFSNESISMLDSSLLNDSLTSSQRRKSRPVPKIPGELLKDSPVPETSQVSSTFLICQKISNNVLCYYQLFLNFKISL